MSLTLYAPFYQTKSLTPAIGPAGACTRAGNAGYYDSAGVYQYAGANTATFDHDPATGESFGLGGYLTRSNFILQSEDFSTTWLTWQSTIDTNVSGVTAPDGAETADRLNISTDAGSHFAYQVISINTGVSYTYSVYVKDDGAGYAGFVVRSADNNYITFLVDLSDGTVVDTDVGSGSGTIDASGSVDVGGGWYRIWMTGSLTSTTTDYMQIFTNNDATPAYDAGGRPEFTGVDGEDVFIWGAQFETTAFLTPYIPTTTVAVAENAPALDWSDVSWYNDSAGTWYIKVRPSDLSVDNYVLAIGSGTSGIDALSIWLDQPAGTVSAFRGTTTGSDGFIQVASAAAVDTWLEIAVAYENNDMVMYVDGVAGTPDTAVTLPPTNAADNMKVARSINNVSLLNGHLAEIRYDNTRLPDETVQSWSSGIFTSNASLRPRLGLAMGKLGL